MVRLNLILLSAALALAACGGGAPSGDESAAADDSAAEEATRPGLSRVFRECADCPEMAVIPAGSFRMGSPSHEAGGYDDEAPVHRVTISEPFALGRTEVTFAQWDACVADGGCGGYRPHDQGWGRGSRPVINVSWEDANAYVSWLSRKTGAEYRLPSEAEWEYAARAGTTTAYSWGNSPSGRHANGGDHVGWPGDGYDKTAPVGSFETNAFGLHDMHGNVLERVGDCWNGSYDGAPGDGRVWESGDCSRRVLRGGSWDCYPRDLRSAIRSWKASGDRYDDNGFRVARTLAP